MTETRFALIHQPDGGPWSVMRDQYDLLEAEVDAKLLEYATQPQPHKQAYGKFEYPRGRLVPFASRHKIAID